jgi:hypothetical protein
MKEVAVQKIRDFKIIVFTWGKDELKGEISTDYFKEGRYFNDKA